MKLSRIKKINEAEAREALGWNYEPPYDFYNNQVNHEAMVEFLETPYYAILNDMDELIGFFCIGESAQVPAGHQVDAYPSGYLDVGLGMKPELTGSGNGHDFCSFILEYINVEHNSDKLPFRLTVADFNKRAIRLYEKLGFVKKQDFLAGDTLFVTMHQDK